MKYKIVKEYARYYLCETKIGFKECFLKTDVKVEDGYVIKKKLFNLNGKLNKNV